MTKGGGSALRVFMATKQFKMNNKGGGACSVDRRIISRLTGGGGGGHTPLSEPESGNPSLLL